MVDCTDVDAGDFGTWASTTLTGFAERGDANVACGSCTACCRSSQFILIEPDDPSRSHIDADLVVPAVGLPDGFSVMGYDEHGACPMLVEDQCTVYEHRPRTCRTYDCRVFPASGIWPDAGTKVEITSRARRWAFTFDDDGRRSFTAIQAAGKYLRTNQRELFGDHPPEPTQLAAMAVAAHELFLDGQSPTSNDVTNKVR